MPTLLARTAAILAGILVVVALAGCGAPTGRDGTEPGPAPTEATVPGPASPTGAAAPLPALTLERGGGIAGLADRWTVEPDGTVTLTGRRRTTATGRLPADERAELARLVADPGLWAPPRADDPEVLCADALTWTLRVGARVARSGDCGPSAAPGFARVQQLVEGAVPTP